MNRLERITLYALCAITLLLLAACGLMTPEQQSNALAAVDEMLRNRSITPAQHEAMREAIMSASSTQWWSQAATALVGGVIGHVTTQVRRGPVATPAERVARKTNKP